jgi:beta-galactosidase
VTLPLNDENQFTWSANWLAERLWDIDDPYLMNARIRLSGKGWTDERLVRFGFREFEVRGKEFYLNGSAVRMRPVPQVDMPLIGDVVRQWVKGVKSLGFNMLMVRNGRAPDIMIDEADRQGLMIFAELPELKNYVVRDTWEENKEDWSRRMARSITEYFNHPSIVMWWSGFNVFAHGEDQNPARIGQLEAMKIRNDEWERRVKIGWEAMDRMRAEDPTRGVYSHNGSIVGDIQTTNVYLCLIPLQEREEWLSDWAEKGDMPFLACEFGLPLDNTFMQGRAGGGWTSLGQGKNAKGAANSAMMLTEYAAVYLGSDAYKLQTNDYADGIVQSHFEGFIHDRNLGLNGWSSATVDPLIRLIRSDAYQRIQVLFNKNTFRSWRGWGMTGGVNPWSFTGHTHVETTWRGNIDNMSLGPFKPGTRGKYRSEISKGLYYNYMEGGWEKLPAFHALVPNNQDLLAYIGGDAGQGFTDKDHQYYSGDRIAKQVVLINDKRDPVRFDAHWRVNVEGEIVAEGRLTETLQPGKNGFIPFDALLPAVSDQVRQGSVQLEVKAAGETLSDEFVFRVYPLERVGNETVKTATVVSEEVVEVKAPKPEKKERRGFFARLFGIGDDSSEQASESAEPETKSVEEIVTIERELELDGSPVMLVSGDGSTRDWLQALGHPIQEWDSASDLPLVIGRGALESGQVQLSDLREWIHRGGVALISSPTPAWVADQLGMRITPHPSRRVFSTAQPHPLSDGFDREDLRDWNGSSRTVEGYPEYSDVLQVSGDKLYHGWRWGNRGSVASFMVEKPHHSGWSPIFEGEFDLAYSPLMELSFGKGRVLLSTFDLEDNVGLTPAADQLAARLVDYASGQYGLSQTKGHVHYVGAGSWSRIFGKMGAHLTQKPDEAKVLVLGKRHGMSDSEIEDVLRSGRNVLMLRGAELPAFSGWSWDVGADNFYGTTEVPVWPETTALSFGDFHSRAPYPFWRIQGEGSAAEGMLARKEVGSGVLIATAFDPTWIRADQQPFMRLTAWRHSRNIVALIAAMGGGLELDSQIFDLQSLPTGKIPLAGEWQLKWTRPLPAAKKPGLLQDDGISAAAQQSLGEDPDTATGWVAYGVPSDADFADPDRSGVDGEFVIQRKVTVPELWAGDDLKLNLGSVDDHDITFWNGERIGSIGAEHPSPYSANRIYRVPAELVKAGENVLSIRVMDLFGGSGIQSSEFPAMLIRPDDKNLQFYHPDYRRDFAYGDDAYRYYRW